MDEDGAEMRVGVDFDRRRIMLIGKGTRYRETPICPELHDILLATFSQAPDGAVLVTGGICKTNTDRDARKFIKAAGLAVWSKPYHSLRSSCINDWKVQGIDGDTREKWSGHSEEVAKKHYLAPTDDEFKLVTG